MEEYEEYLILVLGPKGAGKQTPPKAYNLWPKGVLPALNETQSLQDLFAGYSKGSLCEAEQILPTRLDVA